MVQISDWLSSILTSQNNKILGTLSSCNFPRLIWIKKLFIIASSQKIARKPIAQTSFSFDDNDDLSDLFNDADDIIFDDDEKKNEGFIILMRLSHVPEYLVQGYDFKLLNKYFFIFLFVRKCLWSEWMDEWKEVVSSLIITNKTTTFSVIVVSQ